MDTHQDLFRRIGDIENRQSIEYQNWPLTKEEEEEVNSTTTIPNRAHLVSSLKSFNEAASIGSQHESTFQKDLAASRVYRRVSKRGDQISLISGATSATPWSLLSGLSLADVSIISIVDLPICSSIITNSQRYDFTDLVSHVSERIDKEDLEEKYEELRELSEELSYYFHSSGIVRPSYRWTKRVLDNEEDIWSKEFCISFKSFLSFTTPGAYFPFLLKLGWIISPINPHLNRAVQQYFIYRADVLEVVRILDHLWRRKRRTERVVFCLPQQWVSEKGLMRSLREVQVLALAIKLWFDWLEDNDNSEVGGNTDFHSIFQDPNNPWQLRTQQVVFSFLDEAGTLLKRTIESNSKGIDRTLRLGSG